MLNLLFKDKKDTLAGIPVRVSVLALVSGLLLLAQTSHFRPDEADLLLFHHGNGLVYRVIVHVGMEDADRPLGDLEQVLPELLIIVLDGLKERFVPVDVEKPIA